MAFSAETSKDPAKSRWIANSGYGNLHDVLSSVADAQAQYEERRGDSATRRVLVSLSEKLHHYSAIMDVLIQHHPEYTSLAWGAMKILFVVSPRLRSHRALLVLRG